MSVSKFSPRVKEGLLRLIHVFLTLLALTTAFITRYTYTYSMARRKKPTSKKPTIKIPARPLKPAVTATDESNEPLEFPESPASYIDDSKKVGHLSEADWSAETLAEEDDEVEVVELDPEAEKPGYGSDESANNAEINDIVPRVYRIIHSAVSIINSKPSPMKLLRFL